MSRRWRAGGRWAQQGGGLVGVGAWTGAFGDGEARRGLAIPKCQPPRQLEQPSGRDDRLGQACGRLRRLGRPRDKQPFFRLLKDGRSSCTSSAPRVCSAWCRAKVGERLARKLVLATLLATTWQGEHLPPEAARRGVWPAMALLVVALVVALGAVLLEGLRARLERLYPRPRRKRPRGHAADAVTERQWRWALEHAEIRP